jgi:hypothetical protein
MSTDWRFAARLQQAVKPPKSTSQRSANLKLSEHVYRGWEHDADCVGGICWLQRPRATQSQLIRDGGFCQIYQVFGQCFTSDCELIHEIISESVDREEMLVRSSNSVTLTSLHAQSSAATSSLISLQQQQQQQLCAFVELDVAATTTETVASVDEA